MVNDIRDMISHESFHTSYNKVFLTKLKFHRISYKVRILYTKKLKVTSIAK